MTKGFAWVLAIVVLLVVLLGAKGCTSYNKMVQLEEQVTKEEKKKKNKKEKEDIKLKRTGKS